MDLFNGIDRPVSYELENVYNSARHPSQIHAGNTGLTRYFARYLLQKIISSFKFSNIPDTWEKDYFYFNQFIWGYNVIINTDKFGVIPQWATLSGRGVFWQPTHAVINNHMFKSPKYPIPFAGPSGPPLPAAGTDRHCQVHYHLQRPNYI